MPRACLKHGGRHFQVSDFEKVPNCTKHFSKFKSLAKVPWFSQQNTLWRRSDEFMLTNDEGSSKTWQLSNIGFKDRGIGAKFEKHWREKYRFVKQFAQATGDVGFGLTVTQVEPSKNNT